MMTRDEICEAFLEQVPYELYPFQEEALLEWFDCEQGLLVCAPTGMGKTLLAEAAVFEALHTGKRLYYTTPLIALTEQKYRDLTALAIRWGFSDKSVGYITGNRRENPDAPVRVVVAEILLNHLLSRDMHLADPANLHAVVMDEFHSFNDPERGVVWELSLALLPAHVRVLLLSATVGNPYEFADWLRDKHGRRLKVVTTAERRVPLEFIWVPDKRLTELLPEMVSRDDETNRSPALVFCFNRDHCWELAERLKGLPLITQEKRTRIEDYLDPHREQLRYGAGPKLRQMLLRGVGVHHAGVLPLHKRIVEHLFTQKLVPFVVCTETLAAGVNLPARSVVLTSLIKGKPGEQKLIPPAVAHQMFGRAGRPQYDTKGYVYAVAHEDDVKIAKWRKKYEQLDPHSKDPGILRARKELERKRPTRRKNQQYWSEAQFRQLIEAGPARLQSRSMIPYSVLIFVLTRYGTLQAARAFLQKRFCPPATIEKFQKQLGFMIDNLAKLGYLRRLDDERVELDERIFALLEFRNIDPLYGDFLARELVYSSFDEKLMALESVLELPYKIARKVPLPEGREPGPLQKNRLEPLMIQLGVTLADTPPPKRDEDDEAVVGRLLADGNVLLEAEDFEDWEEEDRQRPPTFPEMLKIAFDAELAAPEDVFVQPKWVAGGAFELDCDFFKLVRNRDLIRQEGLILRHLLRLVLLAREFFTRTEDPDYERISELAARTCRKVDPSYTDYFIADAEARRMEKID